MPAAISQRVHIVAHRARARIVDFTIAIRVVIAESIVVSIVRAEF
jgi:hypothetical protein